MTEQITDGRKDWPQMQRTVFGEVFSEILEVREISATPGTVGMLAEEAGLDGWKFLHRMGNPTVDVEGDFSPLADELGLSEEEMMRLSCAYVYERREPVGNSRRETT